MSTPTILPVFLDQLLQLLDFDFVNLGRRPKEYRYIRAIESVLNLGAWPWVSSTHECECKGSYHPRLTPAISMIFKNHHGPWKLKDSAGDPASRVTRSIENRMLGS
jgi:hypothetical protein